MLSTDIQYIRREQLKDRSKLPSRDHPLWKGGHLGTGKTTEEIRKELIQRQGDVCAICGKHETAKNQHGLIRLAIDHNHKTGDVRGLLCVSCNARLGVLENTEWVEKAKFYLEHNKLDSRWWNL